MSGRFAASTEVTSSRSKAEIESTVERYGASQFISGWHTDGKAVIRFTIEGRQVKFILTLPMRDQKQFTEYTSRGKLWAREPSAAAKLYDQAVRQKWRALALVIKAKLESVESGIAVFDDEFMANIVLPNGQLVSEQVRPAIASAYASGTMPPLLPDYSK